MEESKEPQLHDEVEDTLIRSLLEGEIRNLEEATPLERHNWLVRRLRQVEKARSNGTPLSKIFKLKRKPKKMEPAEMQNLLVESKKMMQDIQERMAKRRKMECSSSSEEE